MPAGAVLMARGLGDSMIKLAVSDLDDTLIAVGRPHATRHALDAIRAMRRMGLHFAPASGRVPWDLGWMFDEEASAYGTAVLINGQVVYIDGELVLERQLDRDELARIGEALRAVPGAALMIDDYGDRFAVGVTAEEMRQFRGAFDRIGSVRAEVPHKKVVKANVHVAGDSAHLAEVRDLLTEGFGEAFDFVYPNPRATLVDILPKGWGKDCGVDYLRRQLGLEREEVVAFGDAENDLSVLRSVPNSTCVSNAVPQVMAASRWHIGASKDDAVADALMDIAAAAATGGMPAYMRGASFNPDAVYQPVGE